MKKQLFFLFTMFFFSSYFLHAQTEDLAPCGNTDYYSPWLRTYLQNNEASARTEDVLYIPLQIHVVGNDGGSGYMSLQTVLRSFCTLNSDFADSDIQFFLANDIHYIDNTAYYDHEYSDGYAMMNTNNVSNAINCYIVSSPAGNCGYFSPGADGIALAKNCTQPSDHTWAHEVGHFLSLPHTFYGWEWADELHFDEPAPTQIEGRIVEKVDGSNCADAADGFCDTPADYLRYRWSCTNGFSNVTQLDPDSIEFVSDGSYYMSYSNKQCKARFSEEQTGAMRANLETQRSYLLTTPPDENTIVIPDEISLTSFSPTEDELIEESSVLLEWAPIPNATHYIVQVNPFSIFSIVFNQFIVEGTSLQFSNLLPNKTFYWRIRPYNNHFTCGEFTNAVSFSTGSVVNVFELEKGEALRLFPNPTNNGYIWMEITSLSANTADWKITDISGRLMQQGREDIHTGVDKISLDTQNMTPGMYILSLQLGERKVFRKFIVN